MTYYIILEKCFDIFTSSISYFLVVDMKWYKRRGDESEDERRGEERRGEGCQ
jgi:hypothetical protein